MDSFFILLLMIFGVILVICVIYYICTLPKRRIKEEIWRREILLYEEKYEAEKAKQYARNVGEITRQNIDKIAKLK